MILLEQRFIIKKKKKNSSIKLRIRIIQAVVDFEASLKLMICVYGTISTKSGWRSFYRKINWHWTISFSLCFVFTFVTVASSPLFPLDLVAIFGETRVWTEQNVSQCCLSSLKFTRMRILCLSCSGDGKVWKWSTNGFVTRWSENENLFNGNQCETCFFTSEYFFEKTCQNALLLIGTMIFDVND